LKWERVDPSAALAAAAADDDDAADAATTLATAPYGVYPRATTAKALKRGGRKLRALDKEDRKRAARQEAKNSLEALVLRSRSQIREYREQLDEHVATEDSITTIMDDLEAVEDWLYDDGENAKLKVYKAKMKEVNDKVGVLFFKLRETQERPAAVQEARMVLTATREKVGNWTVERPQLTDEEKGAVLALVDAAEAWLTEKEAALAEQDLKDADVEPAFTSASVRGQLEPLQAMIVRLQRKPKPKVPKPVIDVESLTLDDDAAAADAEKAEGAAEAGDETADAGSEGEAADAGSEGEAEAEAEAEEDDKDEL
jgi:hypothetical protein